MAWYGYSNSDFFVAGKMLGSGPLGNYSLAWNLSHVTDKLTTLVLQVTPPVLAKVQDDKSELRRYVVRISEAMALTVMPLMIGLALVAGDFVPVVLGRQWGQMVFPLQVLSAYAIVNVVLPLFAQVLNVTGHEAFGMRHNILQFLIMPCLFAIGAYLDGVNGIVLAWVLGHPFLGLRLARYTLKTIDLSLARYFVDALGPSVVACLIMSAAVMSTHVLWPTPTPGIARLASEIAIGATTYVATLLMFFSRRLVGIRAFAQQTLHLRRSGGARA